MHIMRGLCLNWISIETSYAGRQRLEPEYFTSNELFKPSESFSGVYFEVTFSLKSV